MLSGLRILDLSWVLGGPFAGQLLAQLGADVIKVEPLTGDLSRSIPPHFVGEDSSFFLSANRGKRSIALDLQHPDGYKAFCALVKESDAVIYGFRPDVPTKLRIDIESLRAINPGIVIGQLIGIHDDQQHSNTPAFDLVIQALSGLMSITGPADGEPVRIGYQVADLAGGLYLALGTLAALMKRQRTGKGDLVQISLLDCQLSLLTWQAQNYFISDEVPAAAGSRHHMIAPSEAFRGADGKQFVISPTGDKFWKAFCDAIELPNLKTSPQFQTAHSRIANVGTLSEVLGAHFATQPASHWLNRMTQAGVPAAPILDVSEALAQPAALSRQMVETIPNSGDGTPVQLLGNPFKMPQTPIEPLSYPPQLGNDSAEILKEIGGYTDEDIERLHMNNVLYAREFDALHPHDTGGQQ